MPNLPVDAEHLLMRKIELVIKTRAPLLTGKGALVFIILSAEKPFDTAPDSLFDPMGAR